MFSGCLAPAVLQMTNVTVYQTQTVAGRRCCRLALEGTDSLSWGVASWAEVQEKLEAEGLVTWEAAGGTTWPLSNQCME